MKKAHGGIGEARRRIELDLTKPDATTLSESEHLQNTFICLLNLALKLARPSAMTDVVTVSCLPKYGAFLWRYCKTSILKVIAPLPFL